MNDTFKAKMFQRLPRDKYKLNLKFLTFIAQKYGVPCHIIDKTRNYLKL